MRWKSYNSRKPHQVQVQSTKNRNLRLQWTRVHQNWTVEDWKRSLVWWIWISAEAADGWFRIWSQRHESMDPTCLFSTVSTGWWWCDGIGKGGVFGHTLGPLTSITHDISINMLLTNLQCQHGSDSPRKVPNILWNPGHKELRAV